MSQMFEKTAEINKTGMAQVMKGVSALSKTNPDRRIEMADFAKESLAAGAETMKKLAAARTPQAAMEIQGAYLKASFERLQAQAKVMSDLYKGLAKDYRRPAAGRVVRPQESVRCQEPVRSEGFLRSQEPVRPQDLFDPKNFPKLPGLPR